MAMVNDSAVDFAGSDVVEKLLKVRWLGGPAGVPTVIVVGPDQGPAGMGLALDVGGGGIVLRVQRVELLIETMLGRNTGIDRAADRCDRRSLHGRTPTVDRSSLSRRPKKRGPFHLVPVIAKATLERLS